MKQPQKVVVIRTSGEWFGERSREKATLEQFCASKGLPAPSEYLPDREAAFNALTGPGDAIVVGRFAHLGLAPSQVEGFLGKCLTRGFQVFALDFSEELTSKIQWFRTVAWSWQPLETQIEKLEAAAVEAEALHERIEREIIKATVARLLEAKVGDQVIAAIETARADAHEAAAKPEAEEREWTVPELMEFAQARMTQIRESKGRMRRADHVSI